jgi:NAD(P)-dependent dehydrogenase (short-subunit alcohol dehydrogenase family)
MDLGLRGRTAVVTGASRGIGLAVVRTLIDEGVRVAGAARTITDELTGTGAVPIAVDLSGAGGGERLIGEAHAALGGIDFLVNNAGGRSRSLPLTDFAGTDDEAWEDTWRKNFLSVVRTTRAALPHLIERRGVVVNVSSVGAYYPASAPLDYNTAKAALRALGKGLSAEFAALGVRVCTLTPGPTLTHAIWQAEDGFGAALARAQGIDHQELLAQVPAQMGMATGRFLTPEEIAFHVAVLLSPQAAGTVGTDTIVDGGALRET